MRAGILVAATAMAVLDVGPALADEPRAGTTIQDPDLFGGGIALATFGGLSVLAGVGVITLGPAFDCMIFCTRPRDESGFYEVGVPLLVGGIVATFSGIGMALEGGKHVPRVSVTPTISPWGGSVRLVASF